MLLGTIPALGQDFSMRVATDDRHSWNMEPSLRIIAEPGMSDYREIILTNSSAEDMALDLDVANSKTTEGVVSIDDDSEAQSAPYLIFSENPVSIPAGSVKTVRITLETPDQIRPFTETPYLLIASQAKRPQDEPGGQIRAVLPVVNRVAYPIFVGVGDYEQFETSFEIESVEFETSSQGNIAKLWIANTGKLDLPVSGYLKFQDAAFGGQIYGPFEFDNSAVFPESSAFVLIPLTDEITQARWKVFAEVESNDVIKTKIFEQDVRFGSDSSSKTLIFGATFILSIVALVWSLRQFRKREVQPVPVEPIRPPVKTRAKVSEETKPVTKTQARAKNAPEPKSEETAKPKAKTATKAPTSLKPKTSTVAPLKVTKTPSPKVAPASKERNKPAAAEKSPSSQKSTPKPVTKTQARAKNAPEPKSEETAKPKAKTATKAPTSLKPKTSTVAPLKVTKTPSPKVAPASKERNKPAAAEKSPSSQKSTPKPAPRNRSVSKDG